MINKVKISFVLFFSVCSSGCFDGCFPYALALLNNSTNEMPDKRSKPPEFSDGGVAIEKIAKSYDCEVVEYENWEDDDANDSTLTVCFINSTKLPRIDLDSFYKDLEAIAGQIKKAVKYPARYKSYYVIFVKREKQHGITSASHTAGADIPSEEL